MPNILDLILGRKKPNYASDSDGLTGQGGLYPDDPGDGYQNPAPAPAPTPAPRPKPLPTSQDQSTIPPSAFPGSNSSSISNPYVQGAADYAAAPPERPHPSGLRRALGAVAGMVGGGAVAPLIEYGSKGLSQLDEYDNWENQAKYRLEGAKTITDQQRVEEQAKDRELAQRNLEENRRNQDADREQNNSRLFTEQGGNYISADQPSVEKDYGPQTIGGPSFMPASPANVDRPAKFVPPDQFRSQLPPPPNIQTDNSLTVPGSQVSTGGTMAAPGGYFKTPSNKLEQSMGLQRVQPTKTQTLKEKKEVDEADWRPLAANVASDLGIDPNQRIKPDLVPHYLNAWTQMQNANNKSPVEQERDRTAAVADMEKNGIKFDPRDKQVFIATGRIERPPTINVNSENNLIDRESARFAKPHEKVRDDSNSQIDKINDASVMLDTGASIGKALFIPKLITALVSGAGSGVRITQSEQDAIVRNRGIANNLEGYINSLKGQGNLSSQDIQRAKQVLTAVKSRVQDRRDIAAKAASDINRAGNKNEMNDITDRANDAIKSIELGKPYVIDPTGKVHLFDNQKQADTFKAAIGMR